MIRKQPTHLESATLGSSIALLVPCREIKKNTGIHISFKRNITCLSIYLYCKVHIRVGAKGKTQFQIYFSESF